MPLTIMNITTGSKISKKIRDLSNTTDQLYLIQFNKAFLLSIVEYYSQVHGNISRINTRLGIKPSSRNVRILKSYKM
jgi:hypothetical protein